LSSSNNEASQNVDIALILGQQSARGRVLLVTNEGCGLRDLSARLLSFTRGWTVKLTPERFMLDAGQTRTVNIEVMRPPSARAGQVGEFVVGIFQQDGNGSGLIDGVKIISQVVNPASIVCTAPNGSVPLGTAVTIEGMITPRHTNQMVSLDYRSPRGEITTRLVRTTSAGMFRDDKFIPDPNQPGRWTVQADWSGDSDHGLTEPAECSFNNGCPPPMLGPLPGFITVYSGETRDLLVSATDPSVTCNPLTVSFSILPPRSFVRLIENGNGTWTLRLMPTESDAGTYSLIVTVTDKARQSVSRVIVVQVPE
jgi:hypothetical protein